MSLPKYIDGHVYKILHPELHKYFYFGLTCSDKARAEILNSLKTRGFCNISHDDRALIYHSAFNTTYAGIPTDAMDPDEYVDRFDVEQTLKSAGFRRQLLSDFPPPSHDRTEIWRNTISLLRFIRDTCRNSDTHPIRSPYWLLEHLFQFPELTR